MRQEFRVQSLGVDFNPFRRLTPALLNYQQRKNRLNLLYINAIGRKVAISNGKSLRFLYFSVLSGTNKRFSRILACRAHDEASCDYINNLLERLFI